MARGQQRGFARTDRVAEQIRRDLSELIRAELRDPRVQQVSITAVEVTPDYSHAKIFYTALVAESELGEKVFASPAMSEGQMFVRGEKTMTCLGERKTGVAGR